MTENRLENQTLRQKLSHADQIARELLELLEHGLIPKTHVLRRTAKLGLESLNEGDVTDLTMRSTSEEVLKAGKFAQSSADHLIEYLDSIEADILHVERSQK